MIFLIIETWLLKKKMRRKHRVGSSLPKSSQQFTRFNFITFFLSLHITIVLISRHDFFLPVQPTDEIHLSFEDYNFRTLSWDLALVGTPSMVLNNGAIVQLRTSVALHFSSSLQVARDQKINWGCTIKENGMSDGWTCQRPNMGVSRCLFNAQNKNVLEDLCKFPVLRSPEKVRNLFY